MDTPSSESWLDRVDVDRVTDQYITQGAGWLNISRELFADTCIQRYVHEVLYADPGFVAKAVGRYVDQARAESPNAADIFGLW